MWVALFSQSGKEICDLSLSLGRWPDKIITNRKDLEGCDKRLPFQNLIRLSNKPSVEEYIENLPLSSLVTLHGYLRVLPKEICERYKILNYHPGLINLYPELKGLDPQKRVWEGEYPLIGGVIHKVSAELDSGEILYSLSSIFPKNATLEDVYLKSREIGQFLWKKTLINLFRYY